MGETGMCWTTAGPARGWLAGREPRARDFDGWKARDDEVGAAEEEGWNLSRYIIFAHYLQ